MFLTARFCTIDAQVRFPSTQGEKAKYSAYIDMPQGYISGVCVLFNEGTVVNGSVFNEFGITALSFSYDIRKEKIKLYSVVKMLDKWYIRKIMKKDLIQLMKCLQKGESVCQNEKYHITYSFSALNTEEEYDTEE
ncbi:MAG: hypothetical protein IKZ61_12415 [Prevotella sp.]|nr:hypothetical protein [Prevotella sp.]